MTKHKKTSNNLIVALFSDLLNIIKAEFRILFKDRGVVIMLVLGPLAYPLLYCSLYAYETLTDVPVAVVDNAHSKESRELIRHLDATQNLKVDKHYATMSEAQQAYYDKKVHGVLYIPEDFSKKILSNEQAHVSVYCDISSFMYYRIINEACNNCILDMNAEIKTHRLEATGVAGQAASISASPIPYEGTILFNEGAGFASFLMPAILIIVIQQTLFLGIGMLAGTAREENRAHLLVTGAVHRGHSIRVVLGKAVCYLIMYSAWSYFILGTVVRLFNLPHIGLPSDIVALMLPYLLAAIFFSLTISVFFPHRETVMILFLSFSLVLVFISGVSWPQSNINGFWKVFAWVFPSTSAVQGYIKINTMGATLREIKFEYVSLWIQTALYFVTAAWAYRWQIKKSSKKYQAEIANS